MYQNRATNPAGSNTREFEPGSATNTNETFWNVGREAHHRRQMAQERFPGEGHALGSARDQQDLTGREGVENTPGNDGNNNALTNKGSRNGSSSAKVNARKDIKCNGDVNVRNRNVLSGGSQQAELVAEGDLHCENLNVGNDTIGCCCM